MKRTGRSTAQLRGKVHNIIVIARLVYPYSLCFVQRVFFLTALFQNDMLQRHIKFRKHIAVGLGEEFGKSHRSLFAPEIPEIDRVPLKQHMRPWIPDAIMMMMVGWLYPRQFLSMGRPQRVDEAASSKGRIDACWWVHS